MDTKGLTQFINQFWDKAILPTLQEYISIPNQSPFFDKEWRENGYMLQAVKLLSQWCQTHVLPDMHVEVIQIENRTPIIFIETPGQKDQTILLYGHLDKQPEMTGWAPGLHPRQPVIRDDKLYGRGAADDGYAIFTSLAAILSLHQQNIPHHRCVILIEACEESGSFDLPFYIEALKEKIANPNLVICLDSGCGNYDQLWLTTSLRGLVGGKLSIDVLKEGIHSGAGSGIVPSCFRILRRLLNRIEDVETGDITLPSFYVDIPKDRLQQAKEAASVLDKSFFSDIPLLPNLQLETTVTTEAILRKTWKPALSIIGIEGLPSIASAGNVTLPSLSVKLSLRLPPTTLPSAAAATLKTVLQTNPPYQAQVSFEVQDTGPGWNAPVEKPWLNESLKQASLAFFGKESMYMGEGGSIPFMGMLGERFPQAQFMITGVLGPKANAHGPNEFLHIPTAKKLTACVAKVIADHYHQ